MQKALMTWSLPSEVNDWISETESFLTTHVYYVAGLCMMGVGIGKREEWITDTVSH